MSLLQVLSIVWFIAGFLLVYFSGTRGVNLKFLLAVFSDDKYNSVKNILCFVCTLFLAVSTAVAGAGVFNIPLVLVAKISVSVGLFFFLLLVTLGGIGTLAEVNPHTQHVIVADRYITSVYSPHSPERSAKVFTTFLFVILTVLVNIQAVGFDLKKLLD